MRAVILCLALCAVALAVGAPRRPSISETFTAGVNMSLYDDIRGLSVSGLGSWIADTHVGAALQNITFQDGDTTVYYYVLELFSKNTFYEILGTDDSQCGSGQLGNGDHNVWDWVDQAVYNGQVDGYDLWVSVVDYAVYELLVDPSSPDTPVLFTTQNFSTTETIQFTSFDASTPDPHSFDVPTQCGGNGTTGASSTTASGTTASGTTASGTTASGTTASGTTASGTSPSQTTASGTTASGTTASGTTASGSSPRTSSSGSTLPPSGTSLPSGTTAAGTTASGTTASGTTASGTSTTTSRTSKTRTSRTSRWGAKMM